MLSDKLISMVQQTLSILVLGTQALLAPLKAGKDDLAAHVEALMTWQARLLYKLCRLGQKI